MIPRKVLIVGGGAAGWLTAAHLNSVLNRDGRSVVSISLIESPDCGTTATGVATLPNINRILAILGVDQPTFMRRVDGTLRQGTKFVNWLNEKHHFYHPFSMPRPGSVDRFAQAWLKSNRSIPFAETVSLQPALCEQNLSPMMLSRWDFGPPLTYAFHIHEKKFADFLCELLTTRGVIRHLENTVEVEMAENGDIAAVRTESGQLLEADLYIDCSDSTASLCEKAMGVRWLDYSEWLLCDRALAMYVPYEQHYPGVVRPYTTATALSAGWAWDIPLLSGRSLGYVYSNAFLAEKEAENELRNLEGPHAAALDCQQLQYKIGRRENAWVGNCISIGAASASIEPLESTSLSLIDHAAEMLVEHFPLGKQMAPLAFRYNRLMANRFYEILDFVNLHYCLTRRRDSDFWREVQRPERINDRLKAKLDFWRTKRPTPTDFEDQFFPGQPDTPLASSGAPGDYRTPIDTGGLWNHENYEVLLYGMDFLNKECDDWFGQQRPDSNISRQLTERLGLAPQKLPPHDVWLKRVCGMPDYPSSKAVSNR